MTAYIYVLKCPETGAVRYVGKCVNLKARLRQHNSEARIGSVKSHKCDWIRSLQKRGLSPIMEVDSLISSGHDWKSVEVQRVAHYRGLGCDLTNATDGGDEPGELIEEGRKILSDRCRDRFGSPEAVERTRERIKLEIADQEKWAARQAAAKATRATPEYKARMSARAKAKWNEPGYRERFTASSIAARAKPEHRAQLSESLRRAQSSPDVRARKSEQLRVLWAARRAEGRNSL